MSLSHYTADNALSAVLSVFQFAAMTRTEAVNPGLFRFVTKGNNPHCRKNIGGCTGDTTLFPLRRRIYGSLTGAGNPTVLVNCKSRFSLSCWAISFRLLN